MVDLVECRVSRDVGCHDASQEVSCSHAGVDAVVGLEVVAAAVRIEVVGHVVHSLVAEAVMEEDVGADLYVRAGRHDEAVEADSEQIGRELEHRPTGAEEDHVPVRTRLVHRVYGTVRHLPVVVDQRPVHVQEDRLASHVSRRPLGDVRVVVARYRPASFIPGASSRPSGCTMPSARSCTQVERAIGTVPHGIPAQTQAEQAMGAPGLPITSRTWVLDLKDDARSPITSRTWVQPRACSCSRTRDKARPGEPGRA